MKGLIFKDKSIVAESVESISIEMSSATKNYIVVMKQKTGRTILISTPELSIAKKVKDDVFAKVCEQSTNIDEIIDAANTFTVTFNVDGGSTISEQKIKYGGKVSKPQSDPTKEGHDFVGYFKDSNKTTPFNFDNEVITKNTTIYIKWNIKQFTVTFQTNGGTPIPEQRVNWGQNATKPSSDPTKTGNTFGGYFKDVDCLQSFDFGSNPIKQNTTIYVKWTPSES